MEQQVVLLNESPALQFQLQKGCLWKDSLLVPAYFSVLSLTVLLLHLALTSKYAKRAWAILTRRQVPSDSEPLLVDVEPVHEAQKSHVTELGGTTIFLFKFTRLVGVSVLLALSIWTALGDGVSTSGLGYKEVVVKMYDNLVQSGSSLAPTRWAQLSVCLVNAYAFVLAVLSVSTARRIGAIANTHLVFVLSVIFSTYLIRDVWPLATYTEVPKDEAEGIILGIKLALLFVVAVCIPLSMPRRYIPVNPDEPQSEINPEQTASIFSLILFFFLDPIIWKAYKVPHLEHDQLPPLADYDWAKNLVERSFKHLDTFSGAKPRYLFWSLMRVFRKDYIALTFLVLLRVPANFASPIGINRLLNYLETGGEGAYVRPWVWVAYLFLGPLLVSITWQWYIFTTTGALVRAEGILTQLIFTHALRIRVKANNNSTAKDVPVEEPKPAENNQTPENGDGETSSEGEGSTSSETVVASNASTKSAKGKDTVTPSPEAPKKDKKEEKKSDKKSDNLAGKLNNLVTSDLQNVVNSRDFLMVVVSAPVTIPLCMIFLYQILGWSAILGMLVIVIGFPLPLMAAKLMRRFQAEKMKKTDARVQSVTETMQVIRMVKLFGWEPQIADRIHGKREDELHSLLKTEMSEIIVSVLNFLLPVLTMVVTFATYTLVMKQKLTASSVFSSMGVFNMLQMQLNIMFYFIPNLMRGKVSLDRINDFLRDTELLDEFTPGSASRLTISASANEDVIGLHEATFAWSRDGQDGTLTPSKRDFRLNIENEVIFKKGAVNLIIGPTGCGKTSLLMALLGEMHFIPSGPGSWFSLPRKNGVAFAAQESWVQSETIRDNILFGAPYEEERYNKVIYQCGLERDLTLFDAGDKTEVGERGLTLSGGQKARVTLARAIYSKADILLLDDILAALDVHTSKWIIDKCLKGDLVHGRTVILVTHNIAITAPIAEYIVSLTIDGRVASHGSVEEILSENVELMKQMEEEAKDLEKVDEEVDKEPAPKEEIEKKGNGKLIMKEEVSEGHVSWSSIKLYIGNLGGFWFWLVFGTCAVIRPAMAALTTWYLGYWASQYEDETKPVNDLYYLSNYAGLLLTAVLAICISFAIWTFAIIRASRTIHQNLIKAVLGTTLRWLDSTPTSRVLARCTQDINSIDNNVSGILLAIIQMSSDLISRLIAVTLFAPVFVIPGLLLGIVGGYLGNVYMKAQLSVKREMSNAKAPVLGHFGAAVAGLVSIRAYGAQEFFKTESLARINHYSRAGRTFYNLNRWVTVRIETLAGLFSSGLAAYLVYGSGDLGASNTGFSLFQAVAFSSSLLFFVRILNEFEVQGNSLERIEGYINVEQEAKSTPQGKPPAYWPSTGDLRVENLSARYSPDGPVVLHNLSFHIKAGERVGIVGRTGSGKSSLTLSLLRAIFTEGTVYYDSLPTSAVNLDSLRRSITIIPQVPELLSGTLRSNLDPFGEQDDATLNNALRSAGLFELQKDAEENRITLDMDISSGGSNLSVGQRQILALARAMVRESKLLILDEATSAIDNKTDATIQRSLRQDLNKDVTVITIAHRLQTIMDADKIMVLDAGNIVEFDSPTSLLSQSGGFFKSLVDESGNKETLYAIAQKKGPILEASSSGAA